METWKGRGIDLGTPALGEEKRIFLILLSDSQYLYASFHSHARIYSTP